MERTEVMTWVTTESPLLKQFTKLDNVQVLDKVETLI